jgi:hypothetical protein
MRVTLNGREVRGWAKWPLAIMVAVLAVIAIVFVGLPILLIGMAILATAFLVAAIWRGLTGRWPRWINITTNGQRW